MIWLLVIAVAVIVVVIRRAVGEPLDMRDLWVPPVVLTGIGIWILIRTEGLGPRDRAWLAGGSLLGIALGYLRGRFVAVFERSGRLWQRYEGRTFAAVAASLVVMLAFGAAATRCGMSPSARPVQLAIGLSFLGEAVAVTRRAAAAPALR
ncbi:DUF1453 domain-containing protein [Actinoplanes xinjiangensis]|uniref:DUF1453 domain-containing protein n=1 Tax=Actinoplanes xinjiangensis TaxID=512350 RepID=A0A316FCX9_9ACTN|nr:DUF1453 domain-containing protein [Actinoplanes xinjiangensis]PWK44337.1 hypothetical protein BC793_112212 [Actinoplanes xinjiangensis]GIF37903.1 hypothetical protein Axi01nite_22140 [Actinoplanes xinjiangensis]